VARSPRAPGRALLLAGLLACAALVWGPSAGPGAGARADRDRTPETVRGAGTYQLTLPATTKARSIAFTASFRTPGRSEVVLLAGRSRRPLWRSRADRPSPTRYRVVLAKQRRLAFKVRPARRRAKVPPRAFLTIHAHRVAAVKTRRRPVGAPAPSSPVPDTSASSRLYWGAYVDGDRWGLADAPWDMRTLDAFEAQAGKRVSILHWGQPWYWSGLAQPFSPSIYEATSRRGAIPLVDWNPWDLAAGGSADQPGVALRTILSGDHDAYIRDWAAGAREWGKPLFLRFGHEMNGSWYPWSEGRNGNAPGEFARAWRHVRDLFASVGATNVTWVWSPNVVYPGSTPLAGLYPGDAYVDWVAMDGYNFGVGPVRQDGWRSFAEAFGATYRSLEALAPSKPMMVAEVGSSEHGGSKAAWIADALGPRLSADFPRIRALVWFDWNAEGMDWVIESSPAARGAFADAIRSDRFVDGYSAIDASPISPPR
jgi:beta-mannanase